MTQEKHDRKRPSKTHEDPEYRVIVLTVRMNPNDPDDFDEVFDEYHVTEMDAKQVTEAYRKLTAFCRANLTGEGEPE